MFRKLRDTSSISLFYYSLLFGKRMCELTLFIIAVWLYNAYDLFVNSIQLTYLAKVLGFIQFLYLVVNIAWFVFLVKIKPWSVKKLNLVDILMQFLSVVFQTILFIHGSTILKWTLYSNIICTVLFLPVGFYIVLTLNVLSYLCFKKKYDGTFRWRFRRSTEPRMDLYNTMIGSP